MWRDPGLYRLWGMLPVYSALPGLLLFAVTLAGRAVRGRRLRPGCGKPRPLPQTCPDPAAAFRLGMVSKDEARAAMPAMPRLSETARVMAGLPPQWGVDERHLDTRQDKGVESASMETLDKDDARILAWLRANPGKPRTAYERRLERLGIGHGALLLEGREAALAALEALQDPPAADRRPPQSRPGLEGSSGRMRDLSARVDRVIASAQLSELQKEARDAELMSGDPATCRHRTAVDVLSGGEKVARLCPACGAQLEAGK